MITKPRQSFGEPGGEECDMDAFRAATLRSDLCRIATDIDYRSGAKIVDAILNQYEVTKLSRLPESTEKES